jgi:hypothetical protein
MKTLCRLFGGLLVGLSFVLAGCGGGSSSSSGSGSHALEISGGWTINVEGGNTLTANLVPSPCQVTTPIGTFSVYTDASLTLLATTCFIADDNNGQGSISGTGQFFYPPQGVLLGVQADPVPANGSGPIGGLFVEADSLGDYAIFNANGTAQASSKSISGGFACNPVSPNCAGIAGTFTGTRQ